MYVTDAVLLMKSKILGRIKILEPEPDMENMSDKAINSNLLPNLACLILVGISAFGNLLLVLYDTYESRVHAPKWAPYLWNAVFGCELWEWDEFVSNVLAEFDKVSLLDYCASAIILYYCRESLHESMVTCLILDIIQENMNRLHVQT